MKYLFLFLFLFGCGFSTSTKESKYNASYLPKELENKIDGAFEYGFGAYGISEYEFNEVLDTFESIFQPVVQRLGFNMVVERRWEDDTINAYAQKDGRNLKLSFFGGLAKHKFITKYGFALVVCHEYMHPFGGYPFYYRSQFMSVEGKADYGSTACGKVLIKALSPSGYIAPDYEWNEAITSCTQTSDVDTCSRVLAGGLSLGRVLASLSKERLPRYETPDRSVVRTTMETHPRAQCRLDTYLVGALCEKQWNFYGYTQNRVETERSVCYMPRCWYGD